MKRIILLVSPYSKTSVGGIGTWTKNLLDYHSTLDNDFEIIQLNTAFGFKPNLEKSKGNRILHGLIDGLSIITLLLIKIIQYKPKTIHYTSSASYALIKDLFAILIAKIFRVRFVIHFMCGRIPEIVRNQNMEWKMLKIVLRIADLVIVLDAKSLTNLNSLGYRNIIKIPNPISEELYNIAKYNKKEKRKTIESGTIIFIGHIIPEKGVFELVEACTRNNKVKNLVMVGPVLENIRSELITISKQRNGGDWLKMKGIINLNELYYYLNLANVLCLPSYTEGFPNVILEAMVFRCPVIATKVGAIEEMIISEEYGNAGICIDAKNMEQLYDSIDSLISDLNTALKYGINGNNLVLSNYTLDHIYYQYKTIW